MTKTEIEKTVREIISRLKKASDPKRKKWSEGYFPTALTILGVPTPGMKSITHEMKRQFQDQPARAVYSLVRLLTKSRILEARTAAWSVLADHPAAMQEITERNIIEFAQDLDNWVAVDVYCCLVAGPAWREGRIHMTLIRKWAKSDDLWFRRMALVCTVPLNLKSRGGTGDPKRTFAICKMLAADSTPMVAKALSWALREVIQHDRQGVTEFLKEHDDHIPAIVRREVTNKLKTGLKTPRKKSK